MLKRKLIFLFCLMISVEPCYRRATKIYQLLTQYGLTPPHFAPTPTPPSLNNHGKLEIKLKYLVDDI